MGFNLTAALAFTKITAPRECFSHSLGAAFPLPVKPGPLATGKDQPDASCRWPKTNRPSLRAEPTGGGAYFISISETIPCQVPSLAEYSPTWSSMGPDGPSSIVKV